MLFTDHEKKREEELMRTLTVELDDRSYPIYIGSGIRDKKELFTQAIVGQQVMIVTNETIAPLYLSGAGGSIVRQLYGGYLYFA